MTNTLSRTLFGAIAVLFATATLEVSGALAQALPGDVTSTTCGPGTMHECGSENIVHCAFKFDIQINPLTRGGGISVGRYECKNVGVRNLYKDTRTSNSCTIREGPGSGPGGTSSRSGGHDDEGNFGEMCD